MKKLIVMFVLLLVSNAFAATKAKDALMAVQANSEVRSAIAAFEKNRNQTCDSLEMANVEVHKNSYVKAEVKCNEYDSDGLPQANVYVLEFAGHMFPPNIFVLDSLIIMGME